MDAGFLLAALIELRADTAKIHDRLIDLETRLVAELEGRCPHMPVDRMNASTFDHVDRYMCRQCGVTVDA